MKKRLLSVLIALSMIFSVMPTSLLTNVSADSTYTFLDIENVVYDSTGHLKSITVKSNQSNSAIAGTEDVVLTLALDRKSTRLNSSHPTTSRMPSSA